MHVLRLKGIIQGIHVQAWHLKKRLEHYSCLTTVLIVLMLHYLKLEK